MINLIQNYFTDTNTAFNYLVLLRSFSTVDEFDHFYSSVYKTIVDRSSDILPLIPSLTEYSKMSHTQDDYITNLSKVNKRVCFVRVACKAQTEMDLIALISLWENASSVSCNGLCELLSSMSHSVRSEGLDDL